MIATLLTPNFRPTAQTGLAVHASAKKLLPSTQKARARRAYRRYQAALEALRIIQNKKTGLKPGPYRAAHIARVFRNMNRLRPAAKRALAQYTRCELMGCASDAVVIDAWSFYPCKHCGNDAFTGETLQEWAAQIRQDIHNNEWSYQ